MAARTRKIVHDEETRAKIQAANIIHRLYANVMGEVDLSPAQVSSAKTLLNKVLPDLQAMTISGDDTLDPVRLVSRIELVAPNDDSKT